MTFRLRRDRIAFAFLVSSLLVALLAALPLATVRAAGAVSAVPAFELVDRNKDGFVDRREAEAVPGLPATFSEMDRNGDGRLDRIEFARW